MMPNRAPSAATARRSTYDDLVDPDDELVCANKDDAVLRPRKTRRSQNGELVVRRCELIVRVYGVVVSGYELIVSYQPVDVRRTRMRVP